MGAGMVGPHPSPFLSGPPWGEKEGIQVKYLVFKSPLVRLLRRLVTFNVSNSSLGMILSFGSSDTESIWKGNRVKKLPNEIQHIGRRKLRMLNNAIDLTDLKIPPSNRLEKLSGTLKDFYSIRINDKWRIIFKWKSGNAMETEIIDYH